MPEPRAAVASVGENLFGQWASCNVTMASLGGRVPDRLAIARQAESEAAAVNGARWMAELDALEEAGLPRNDELTRRYLRFEAAKLADAAELHAYDFQVTPYRIGLILADVHRNLRTMALVDTDALERYRFLLDKYRLLLTEILANLREQARQGLVVPAPALPGCIAAIKGLAAGVEVNVGVSPARLAALGPRQAAEFSDHVARTARDAIRPAFERLLAYLEGEYSARAGQSVGLWQYPGGSAAYETLIRHHTTVSISPDDLHRRGLGLVAEIEDDMARVRSEIGFAGSAPEFLGALNADARFRAHDAEDLEELYMRIVARGEAQFGRLFGARRFPPYEVRRLPPEAEAGMTFGYYSPPSLDGEEIGAYNYNGSNLDQRPTFSAATLIYHELVPGHHSHVSTELLDEARPRYRRYPTITAFNEGWAEYAADLGFELELYDEYDRYGRYLMQLFLASRLVVDTGLNAFGWSLDQARAYMREHSAMTPVEIESETLRYATSLPGQSLAYAPGRKHLWAVRRRAEDRLGARFDLPSFHDAILDGGSLPLEDLSFSIDQWVDQRLSMPVAG